MTRAYVFFHAHPDDEALLTAGTMAMLAAAGHRVVLVVATDGEAGLAETTTLAGVGLAARRSAEVEESARILGCARVIHLNYPDSGWSDSGRGPVHAGSFADLDLEVTAGRLAEILRAENAAVLSTYDRNGGYGHPDHVRVHTVGMRAAQLAGTPRVMQATIDRTWLSRAVTLLKAVRLLPAGAPTNTHDWYAARREITHRIPVQAYANLKRQSLKCHASQQEGAGGGIRTAGLLVRLPGPLFTRVCGFEWFIEAGASKFGPPETDFFTSVRVSSAVDVTASAPPEVTS